jgi:hypothetical protein
MGLYIDDRNLPGEDKERFLNRVGEQAALDIKWGEVPKGCIPVLLIHKEGFTIGAVCDSERELQAMREPIKNIPPGYKQPSLYIVPTEKLIEAFPAEQRSQLLNFWSRSLATGPRGPLPRAKGPDTSPPAKGIRRNSSRRE